jgi:hypothetical protein
MTEEVKSMAEKARQERNKPAVSAILPDGALAEMVYRREEGKTIFCMAANGEVRYEPTLLIGGERLVPYSPRNSLLQNDVVLFPSEAIEYESEEQLTGEIRAFIHRYVDLSPLFEEIACYYVLFSWVYDAFNELPYLRVRGDAGSGKTRFLRIVGSLCYKPIFASGASTVSPLFRMIDAIRGTLIVDEGDFRFSDETVELIKILNNGNGQGFPVLRSEAISGKEFRPQAYNVYGPKLIATRGYFQDRALETRCITEEMGGRKLREDVPINLNDDYKPELRALQNKLLNFRFRNFRKCRIDPTLVDRSVEPRLAQIFVPLLSVIEDGNMRAALRGLMREYQREMVADRGMEIEALVLGIVRELQQASYEPGISIREVTRQFSERHAEDVERKVTPHWIGYIVRRKLGLKTEQRHGGYVIAASEGAKLARLYEKYGLAEASVDFVDSVDFEGSEGTRASKETPLLPEQ